MEQPVGLTRRSTLSLAAAGLLAAGAPPITASGAVRSTSSLATTITGSSTSLRTVAPGAGIKTVYKDVFKTSSFLDMLLFVDAGVPKLVTATTGNTNQFQVFDASTGKREYVSSTPTGEKIAANLAWDPAARMVYAGSGGQLLAWSPTTRKLISLGQTAPAATGIYGFDTDAAGRLWGGSYPDGIVWNYDPKSGKLSHFPPFDDRTDYVRALGIWKDVVFAGTGAQDPHLVSFPVGNPGQRTIIKLPDAGVTGFVHRVIVRGDKIFVFAEDSANATRCHIYNAASARWEGELKSASSAFSAPSGTATWHSARSLLIRTDTATMAELVLCPTNITFIRSIAVSGDRIFAAGQHAGEPVVVEYSIGAGRETRRVRPDALKGALNVQSLIGSDHGLLYLGAYQGDGLATLNPATDARWQSSSTAGVSQIENLIQYDTNRFYLGSYGSAKLYSFDRNRISAGDGAFTLITTLRKPHMQSRPFAWAAAGGKVLVGTVPEYGLRGGALSIIDPVTNRLGKVMARFIPEQSIVGLCGYGDIAYGSTSGRGGYGVDDYPGDACVFAYEARTDKVLWTSYLKGHRDLYSPILMDGVLYVATINGLLALDPSNGQLQQTFAVRRRMARPGYQSARAVRIPGTTKIVHDSGGIVMLIDVIGGTQSVLGESGFGTPLAVMPDGRVFAAYQNNNIAELHTGPNPTLVSASDLVTINAAGELLSAPSNGAGGYGAPVRHGTGWDTKTILSFHVTDWDGNGILDILIQRTSGTLELSRGKVNGGFEAPVRVAAGWATKRIAVGPWINGIYPTVIGVDRAGEVRRHPVGASGTIGTGFVLGTGWKDRNITMLDMKGNGRQGLMGRLGAKLYFQPSNGKGAFQGPAEVAASAGWSDTMALASVQSHFRSYSGLLSVKRSGVLQYISAHETGLRGIITYSMDLRNSLLAGSPKF